MRFFGSIVACVALVACATPTPSLPDFRGDYTRENRVTMVDGSGGFTAHDGVRIGPTRDGRATVRIQLFFTNGHQCNLSGDAEVTGAGLIYRDRSDEGEAFTLAIDIAGPTATLRPVEGSGFWLCGARGRWGGVFEKTGKRVAFVNE